MNGIIMRFLQILLASALVFSGTSNAQDVSNSNYEQIEAEAAKAKAFSEFSGEYQKHLELKDARKKAVRGTFAGDFKFKQSSCVMGGVGGVNIGSTAARRGSQDSSYECDCPKGTKKLGCLISARSITRFAKEDMGGVGYVMLFADDGDQTHLLIDNQWQPFIAIKKGKSTYTVSTVENKPYEYNIPFNRRLCGNGSAMAGSIAGAGKTYRILAGYGVADTMDLKYLAAAKENGAVGEIDEQDFLWSSARLDGFRMRNARPIGVVTCN
jgi:hypothetical protein